MFGKNKIGDWHLIYDGVPLSDHFIVKSIEMPLMPSIEASTIAVDGKPGLWFASRKIGTRDIVVHLAMMNDNKDRVDMMVKWMQQADTLAKDGPRKLELGGGYYVNAMMIGDSLINRRNGYWGETDLTFRCFDPYIYGETHTVDLKAGDNTFMVHGKQPVWPVFEVTGHNSSAPNIITDAKTAKLVKVNTLTPSTRLVVDMEQHKCTVNGVYKAVDPSVTDFFSLAPGENTIKLAYGTGTVTYRETYL